MKASKQINQQEIQSAIHKFIESGGIIEKLPEQKTVKYKLVGSRWCTTEIGGENTL